MRPYDILAIGYACVDYVTIMPHLPKLDEKILVDNLLVQGGGVSATAMVAASRLGAKTALMTMLSDDSIGREIAEELEREGVDMSVTPVRDKGSSAFSFCMIDKKTGLRTIVSMPPTGKRLSSREAPLDVVRKAKVLFIDGHMHEAQLAAAKAARRAGVRVIFDAGNEKKGMEEMIPHTDVLIASFGFGRDVGGRADPAAAAKSLFGMGRLEAAAVTAGKDGAYFCTAEGEFHQPAFKVNTVDTTGAGDAFHGAYAYAMVQGWPVRRAACFAAAVAAMKCTRPGGRTGLPTLPAVKAFLAKHSLR
jgi:sugar/nucleoside kinase (ribokinase family)